MNTNAVQQDLPLKYFLLAFVLSVPFWLLGGKQLPLPVNLPASAFGFFVPSLAAAVLLYRQSGLTGVREFLQKAWDYRKVKNKIWYLPAMLLAPVTYVLSYVVMRLAGSPLPDPQVPWRAMPVYFVAYLIGSAGEELGWTGYAIDPMQKRWGAVKASFILGVVWAIWHSIPYVQTRHSAGWVVWQCIKIVATRMVIVWIYNRSGKSVLTAMLYHATDNVSWSLFPNNGSAYNPFVSGLITWLTAGIVIVGWGGKALGKYRHTRVDSD